jgi:hypothetical protein
MPLARHFVRWWYREARALNCPLLAPSVIALTQEAAGLCENQAGPLCSTGPLFERAGSRDFKIKG